MKRLIIFSLVLVLIDQITKQIFTNKEYMFGSIGINYTENTGAAFGILQGWNIMLIAVSLIVIGVIIYYYKGFKWKLPLILIFSGAIGNLIDRVIFGYVRDFIAVSIWPVFNIADSVNTIGVLLLLYYFLKEDKINKQKEIKN